jgi:hypothetical protein
MNHQNPTLKKAMVEAMKKSLGIVSTACAEVGINRSTHYDWLAKDEEYKAEIDAISESVIDFAESKLHALINKGDVASTIFYLKTKGKKRGFIERQEITGEEGQPIIKIAGNL